MDWEHEVEARFTDLSSWRQCLAQSPWLVDPSYVASMVAGRKRELVARIMPDILKNTEGIYVAPAWGTGGQAHMLRSRCNDWLDMKPAESQGWIPTRRSTAAWRQVMRAIMDPPLLLAIIVRFYWKITLTSQYTWLDDPDLA